MRLSKYLLIPIILISILSSCKGNRREINIGFPMIEDSTKITSTRFETNNFETSTSHILYLGKEKKSININYNYKEYPFYPPPPPPPPKEGVEYKRDSVKWNRFKKEIEEYKIKKNNHPLFPLYISYEKAKEKYPFWTNSKLEVSIDTTQIILHDISMNEDDNYFSGYPILIKNKEEDTIVIGYENYVPIVLEAKNKSNEWQPIEEIYVLGCGNGMKSFLLPPDHILISSKPIYKGDYQTDLRIKLGNTYSQIYRGTINLGQFKNYKN